MYISEMNFINLRIGIIGIDLDKKGIVNDKDPRKVVLEYRIKS